MRAAGLAVLILGFLVAACYGIVDATKQLSFISRYFQTSSWIAAQVQAEYLRFHGAVTGYWAEPSPAAQQFMFERLDVFWSRLPVALEGDESSQVRKIPGAAATLKSVEDDLPAVEAELRALRPGDAGAYHALLDHLERYRLPLNSIAQAMMIGDKTGANESEMRRGGLELVLSFFAVVVVGAVFIALVLHGKQQNQRLYLQARDSAQQLDLVKSQLVDAIESISESFVLFDRNERLVLANTRFKEFHGGGDLIRPGAALEDVLRADAARSPVEPEMAPEAWIEQRLAQCRNPGAAFELILANGRIISVSDRRTSQGGYVSVGIDITDKKAAEKLLEGRLAAIEASLDGIAILDRQGRYMYLNRSHPALHGYDNAAQLIGETWHVVYEADEQRRFEQSILPQLRGARSWRGDATGRRRDGTTFPQELSLTSLDDGSLVCVVRDASERRRADEERARLLEQFHFAQRSEAIARLAGGIAHDFNNILGIMTGFTELSQLDLGDEHPVKPHLDKVLSAGRRAKSLVQQILAYIRQSGSNRQPLRIDLLLKETSSLLRATLPTTIRLSKKIGGAGTLVMADASQIDQIVMNLCVNAMHAIGDRRGSISLPGYTGSTARGRPRYNTGPSAMPVRIGKGNNHGQ
jgi:PAS domain S-box-containing protein